MTMNNSAVTALVFAILITLIFCGVIIGKCLYTRWDKRDRLPDPENPNPRQPNIELQPQHPHQVRPTPPRSAPPCHPHPPSMAPVTTPAPAAANPRQKYNDRVIANLGRGRPQQGRFGPAPPSGGYGYRT